MILALLACEPGSVVIKGDSGEVTGDTAGADSGTDTEDTSVESAQLCGNIAGVVGTGTHWVYTPSMPQSTSTRERTVTSVEEDRVLLEDVQITAGSNYSYTFTNTYDYRCDTSGMWLLGTQVLQETSSGGTESSYAYDIAYTNPVQMAPGSVEFGSVWQSNYEGNYVYENGVETPFSYSELNTVVGADPTELAIGEVTVYRVITEQGMTSTTNYYGEEIGLVQDSQWLISDYDP